MNTFGDFLKIKRTNKHPKVSMRELSRRCGLDVSYISRIESGEYVPSRQAVINIANALGESEDDFLINAGYIPDNSFFSPIDKDFETFGKEIIKMLINTGELKENEVISAEKSQKILNIIKKAIEISRI